jgi:uncharacterized membrane protein YczE
MQFNWQRFSFYTIGLVILSLGIALTIQSQLGASPFDALLVGLYTTFGLTIGSWEIVVGFSLVMINAAAQRKKPEYFALLTSLFTGMGIDFWMFVIRDWMIPEVIWQKSICLIFGMIFIGLGIAINLQANYAPNPMDRTMLVIRGLTGLNVAVSRIVVSGFLVIAAFLFSGPIGIGTLLNAVLSGFIIQFFIPYIAKLEKSKIEPSNAIAHKAG